MLEFSIQLSRRIRREPPAMLKTTTKTNHSTSPGPRRDVAKKQRRELCLCCFALFSALDDTVVRVDGCRVLSARPSSPASRVQVTTDSITVPVRSSSQSPFVVHRVIGSPFLPLCNTNYARIYAYQNGERHIEPGLNSTKISLDLDTPNPGPTLLDHRVL